MAEINPYEAPQTTAAIPFLAQLRNDWQGMTNTDYDNSSFPSTILFKGQFRIRDFDILIATLHQTSFIGWILVSVLWLTIGVFLTLPLIRIALVNWHFVLLIYIAIAFYFFWYIPIRSLQRIYKWWQSRTKLNPLQGTISPTGITLTERSVTFGNTTSDPTEFYAWEQLFVIEQIPPHGEIVLGASSNVDRREMAIPTRIVLYTQSDKAGANERKATKYQDRYFYELICLDPNFFASPGDWEMLVQFLREHCAK